MKSKIATKIIDSTPDATKREVSEYADKLILSDVVVMYCQCEELSNLNDSIIGIDTCIKCDRPIDRQY